MPELPEVETVKNVLKKHILGKKIINVNILYHNIITAPSSLEFQNKIIGQIINDIKRRGKWLMIELDDYYLLSHLRMEGKYFFKKTNDPIEKHEHIIFKFENNEEMRYHDTRKFGKMYLIKKEDVFNTKPLSELGLEPWDDNLNEKYLKEKYEKKELPIKTLLLDQSIITGIGNIYADEILFLSKINPFKKGKNLTKEDRNNIIKYTKLILEEAIKEGGTTIRSYTSEKGVHGKFQNKLLVHNHQGSMCPKCNTIIEKKQINGRSTYYCKNCQNVNQK